MINVPHRRTLFSGLPRASGTNLYCQFADLGNEASVEDFFAFRMIQDLGYSDAQIKPKESLEELVVGQGRRRNRYKPDYALLVGGQPVCIIEAKPVTASLEDWVEQGAGYCLALNRRYPSGSNPVGHFVLTNGRTTKIYDWDRDEPKLILDFADFDWSSHKYQELHDLLRADRIARSLRERRRSQDSFTLTSAESERARQLFANCHQAIREEGGGPSYAFHEFAKVLFVKLWCDDRLRNDPDVSALFHDGYETAEVPRHKVIFSVNWIEQREDEGSDNPINSILFDKLRREIETQITTQNKKRIFASDEQIRLNADTVKDIVRKLEHYDLFGIDEDLNGRLFETYLSATMRGRELGQYFTPRSIVEMITYLADLRVERDHVDSVLDGCCGSGGFLIEALTVMRNKVRENTSLSSDEKSELIDRISNNSIFGVDFAKDPPLARVARINMYLHGDGGSRIYEADFLDKDLQSPVGATPELVANTSELRGTLQDALFDVVLTNPPFSMRKKKENPSDKRILADYELAHRSASSSSLRPSLRSNIMFMERYADAVRPGGKLITVIDDTLLASAQQPFPTAREFIRRNFLIRAIISLPGDAFRRQGSRVKTSVLVLEKKQDQSDQQPACFGFFSESLGVDDLAPKAPAYRIEEARLTAQAEMRRILSGYRQFLDGQIVTHGLVLDSPRLSDRLDLKSCAPELGRMVNRWVSQGVEIKTLQQIVHQVRDEVTPSEQPSQRYTLLKVSYDGVCEIEREAEGKHILARNMFRVKEGQIVFSVIRATNGAIGIVPSDLDGALVSSDSYLVFNCKDPEDAAYLWAILRTHELRADMQALSKGSGRYTTDWEGVSKLQVPWLQDDQRSEVVEGLIATWELERQTAVAKQAALKNIVELGVESDESVARWSRSKAPQ